MIQKNILLVEDNQSDIELAKRALAKARIMNELIVAEDGEEALNYLFRAGKHEKMEEYPLPAVILLDIKLPGIDGLEVLKQIRETPRTHRLPVVILTSSKEEMDMAMGYDLGVNSYIRKPVDFRQFAEAIEHLGLYWLVLNEIPPVH